MCKLSKPVGPGLARDNYVARRADGIDYADYVVRRGAYGRTVVRRGPLPDCRPPTWLVRAGKS